MTEDHELIDDSNLTDDHFDSDPLEPPASTQPEMSDADRIRRIVKAAQDRIASGRPSAGDYDLINEYAGKPGYMDWLNKVKGQVKK